VTATRRAVRAEPVLLALLVLATALFGYRWAFDNNRPHSGSPGWHAFHDQGYYFHEAGTLDGLDWIPPTDFVHGPGYPMLAAPFARLGALGFPSGDPFFAVDLAVWLLAVAATYVVGRRVGGEWVGVASTLALLFATPLVDLVELPWNTTATLGAVAIAMLVATAGRLTWWHGALLGVAVALAYSARYVDALWVAIACGAILWARGALTWRSPPALAAAVAAYLAVLPTLVLQWHAFGNPLAASYRRLAGGSAVKADAFDPGNVVPHALQTFVSPFYFDEAGFRTLTARPVLATMFFVLLAPIGVAQVLRASGRSGRIVTAGFACASALATLFYLSYYFTGSYGLHYGAVHYFKAWWPLWTVASVAGAASVVSWLLAQRRPRTSS